MASLAISSLEVLRKYWGYDSFREPQSEIVDHVLSKKSALVLLPTGAGKSLCYQVPGLILPGLTIVVSPLIALMKDQVSALNKKGIPALAIYSGMSSRDIDRELDNAVYGKYKFLYLSPERLQTEIFRARLPRMEISLIAVDEAHCISQWGYDFRPAYLKIRSLIEAKPNAPVLALTATATQGVQLDLLEQLGISGAPTFKTSFVRPNLCYRLVVSENKAGELVSRLKNLSGSAIVYVRSRRGTKQVSDHLNKFGVKSSYYHAGLDAKIRERKQEDWMVNKSQVMVCTTAFGMGIDKPDVRCVFHTELPDSIESYFQEAGRAGRDGKAAEAILLYHASDESAARKKFERQFPDQETIKRVYKALGNHFRIALGAGLGQSFDFQLFDFCKEYKLNASTVHYALKSLEELGLLSLSDGFRAPSQIKMLVDNERVYAFYLRHPNYESLIKQILRTYSGSFEEYVTIHEGRLARALGLSKERVVEALKELVKFEICTYIPAKSAPQIVYLEERLPIENLNFNQQQIELRKKVKSENLEAMMTYAGNATRCRSLQLVNYFGDDTKTPCGKCDVCLSQKGSQTLQSNAFRSFEARINQVLLKPTKLVDLLGHFSEEEQVQVRKVLRWQLDKGALEIKNEVLRKI